MTRQEVEQLLGKKAFPGGARGNELIETHISWVILTGSYAYKIKRPRCFSFLDFSTLEKRRYFCERELELNLRLAPEMYLKVLPVMKTNDGLHVGKADGERIDYALQMKQMDNDRRMDQLLQKDKVSRQHMRQIASTLASFHLRSDADTGSFKLAALEEDFADLLKVRAFIGEQLGAAAEKTIDQAVRQAALFLKKKRPCFEARSRQGFVVDGHGDLHSRNIFLMETPVIFDCIEFNDHLRQVDVLDELAFFCMDLKFHGKKELEAPFLEKYLNINPCISKDTDWQIFHFYKWYRANVRLKVHCLNATSGNGRKPDLATLMAIRGYFELFADYGSVMARLDFDGEAFEN